MPSIKKNCLYRRHVSISSDPLTQQPNFLYNMNLVNPSHPFMQCGKITLLIQSFHSIKNWHREFYSMPSHNWGNKLRPPIVKYVSNCHLCSIQIETVNFTQDPPLIKTIKWDIPLPNWYQNTAMIGKCLLTSVFWPFLVTTLTSS